MGQGQSREAEEQLMSGIRVSKGLPRQRLAQRVAGPESVRPGSSVGPCSKAPCRPLQVTQGLLEQLSGRPRHVKQASRSQALL